MGFHELKGTVTQALHTTLFNPMLANSFKKPRIISATDSASENPNGQDILVAFRTLDSDGKDQKTCWLVNCCQHKTITVETLKTLKDSLGKLPGNFVKGTIITSEGSFLGETVDYALANNIGLARLNLDFPQLNPAFNDILYRTSPMELKNALCSREQRLCRKKFYGITTSGKIEHLGSLDNYVRSELFNSF